MLLHAKQFNDPRSKWLSQYWRMAVSLTTLLYRDYTAPTVVQPANPLNWWADKVGLSVSRSSWNNDAAIITFYNAPSKKSNHEHRDNNSFTVYKHTPLLIDAGYYDSYSSNHYMNYYQRTIAHNTICVYDGSETYTTSGTEVSNDGGQVASVNIVKYDDVFKPSNQRGKWMQYATGDGYTYNVADAQLSYDPEKLDFFRRRLLYIKPEKIIVLDHVHLKNTATKQRDITWIAHFVNRPNISGNVTRTDVANHIITYNGKDYTAANSDSNIALCTLIPINSNTTLIGGTGYEYWVDGKNYPPDAMSNASYYPGGSWRIEVRPNTIPADGNVVYLHTIDIGETTNPSKAGGIAFQNETSIGTDWDNTLYFFAADGGIEKDGHIFEGVTGGRTVSIHAADLLPGLYGIKIGGTVVTTKNTDDNGVLQASANLPAGKHTVEICKDCPTDPPQPSGPSIDIPGIFTPNGDGYNDTWEIPGIEHYPNATISIYNRAKKLMVELKGSQLPWDGREHNGNLLESGYYLYQVRLTKDSDVISGFVTILR